MARPEFALGKDLRDAKRPATINIRQRDIAGAVARQGDQCVAARCVLRSLDAAAVWFYRSKCYVMWDDNSPILRYQNSAALIRDVIVPLDNGKPRQVKSGTYDLLAPTKAQRLGVDRRAKNPGSGRKGRGKTASHHVTARMSVKR